MQFDTAVCSPLGRSALYCSLWYKFDIRCLLNVKFNHCSVTWNHYESTVSSELLAKVAVLRGILLFRDNPNLCTGLFDTDEIAAAIKCICTDCRIFSVCLSFVYFNFLFFMLYSVYDFNNNKQESCAIAEMTAQCATWVPWQFSGLPDYAYGYTIPNIFHGLLFWSTIWMFLQNLKSVALPVPEIIGIPKIWAFPGYAHAPFSPKFLMGFYSDWPCKCIRQIWSP